MNSEAAFPDNRIDSVGCIVNTGNERDRPDRALLNGDDYTWSWWGIDAAKSKALYGKSSTVQPSAIQTLIIIKI